MFKSDSSLSNSDSWMSSPDDENSGCDDQRKISRGSSQRRIIMSPPEPQRGRNRRATCSKSRSPSISEDDRKEDRKSPHSSSEYDCREDSVQGTTKRKSRDKSTSRSVSPEETQERLKRGLSHINRRTPSPTSRLQFFHSLLVEARDKSRSCSVSTEATRNRSNSGLSHSNFRSPSPTFSSEDADKEGDVQNEQRRGSRSQGSSQHATPMRANRRLAQSQSRSPSCSRIGSPMRQVLSPIDKTPRPGHRLTQKKSRSPSCSPKKSSSVSPTRTPSPMRWEGPHPSDIKLEPGLGPSTNWGRTPLGSRSPSLTLDPMEESIAVEESMKCYAKERELSMEKKERHDEIDADDFDDFDGDEEDDDDEGYGLSAENTLKQEFYLIIKELKEKKLRIRGPPIVKSPLPLTKQKVRKVYSG